MSELPPLPPGFTLDGAGPAPAPAAADGGLPPLPPGFSLDGEQPAAPDNRSFLGKVGDGATNFAKNVGHALANTRMSDIVKGVANSAGSAATLPGDVFAGRVDPNSEEGLSRAGDMAMFVNPAPIGARVGRQAVQAAVPQIAKDAEAAGITLSAGQRAGNPALLAKEDALAGGAYGAGAQEAAQAARARQATQTLAARDNIGEMAGRGQVDLQRPAEAGALVSDALKDTAAQARQGFKSKYEEAFSSEGVVKPEAFKGISGRITEALTNRAEPVIIDEVLTPAANRAVKELDNIQNLKLGTTGQPAAGEEIAGVNLRGVDQARRKLVAYYNASKANPTDARAVRSIIDEFDNHIQQAVDNGLFQGDEAFLGALKDARAAYSSYQKTFKPRGAGDDVGRTMQTIIERDATPEQVANYLYGASKVGDKPLSVRLASRLKGVLGEESEQWSAIRQGAWQKITGVAEGRTEMGPQKMSERIFEFTNGNGQSLARQLFSPEEIAQMNRFANIQKAMAVKPGTANLSQSGNRLGALARESFASVSAMLGAHLSGPQGAAAGYAAGKAINSASGALATRDARALFSGSVPAPIGARVGDAAMGSGRYLALPAGGQIAPQDGRRR